MIPSCFWLSLGFIAFFNGIEIVTCTCDIQFELGSNKLSASNNENYTCGKSVAVKCTFNNDILYRHVKLVKISGNTVTETTIPTDYSDQTTTLQDTIYSSGLYRCQYYKGPNHNTAQDPKCATNVTIYTTGSGDTCHIGTLNGTVTPPPSTIGSHFPGLNPLIYTVVSGLLLFILILVSIITCWIRSRKNARMRSLLPQESPQDYLDYIQQGQFTPLTSIEFVASLRERPPTYNESQVIQRRMDEESPSDDDAPPPLPPRNPSMRSSPIETETETQSDTPTIPTTIPRPPVQSTTPDTTTITQPTPATPNLFPNDVSLSNFLLDDSDIMDQLPPPLLITPNPPEEGSSGADIITSEGNSVLMGVIPSINNAMV